MITILWYYMKFARGQEPQGIHERGQWLLRLYVEANRLLEPQEDETAEQKAQREQLDAERRELYRRWDEGDPEVRRLWLETRQWSIDEMLDVFRALDIHIDVFFYESEVDEPAKEIVEELVEKGIAEDERPDGPVIVKIDEKLGLKKEKYRTNIILRSDGTTLYLTKDLALARVKFEKYHVDRSIYVVDARQSLHLQQTFKILELWGFKQAEKCHHLGYGFVSLPEGAMSARKGRLALFMDVYNEAIRRVLDEIARKNPDMPESERRAVAEQVGLGAMTYSILSVDNNKDIVFDIEAALNFSGDFHDPLTGSEVQLIDLMSRFPNIVRQAADEYRPLLVATYAYDLANAFHSFYHAVPVIQSEDPAVRQARLRLVAAARQVLANSLRLLDIAAPEIM